ncbi:hypothetical protein HGRIS_004728 [Hohenbuehelia grisea]|uniref:Post-SET domain-containing protein n=1 Tax=Hohenbuehelia grisea TaxID=104357 RepID=A0ABR3JCZ6_9AGAR
MKPTQEGYVPSHENFAVEFLPGEFSSYLKTNKAFKAGEVLAYLEGLTKGPRAYTSVQCGPGVNDHVELNSDLVYVNHSCSPTIAFDMSSSDSSKWHVRALEDLEAGAAITFFYPSSEWDMDQAFDCQCGSPNCYGRIQGAAYLSKEDLQKQKWINPWIWRLVEQREDSKKASTSCLSCGHGTSALDASSVCGCKKTIST